jgi:exodeoxyribonuclease VII large subunit
MSRPPEPAAETTLTLQAFLQQVQAHVARLPVAWVEAQVVSLDQKGPHVYLLLAQSDGESGTVATSKAALWRTHRDHLLEKFQAQTGVALRPGLQVRVQLRASLHPRFGFSLAVEDIDPQYTVGGIERRLAELRRYLRETGVFDRNRTEHPRPKDFFHVAVLSPEKADALADFREVADRLEASGLCAFTYRTALFQGDRVVESVFGAFKELVERHRAGAPLCALCVIRGGGAATDLADLNQLRLAQAICFAPFPVLTGIGHEPDHGLLDDVASARFDTPSKVALHLETTILERAREARADWAAIQREASRRLQAERLEIERQAHSLASRPRTTEARLETELLHRAILALARGALASSREKAASDMATILGLSPQRTLDRGFAVIRGAGGKPVTKRVLAERESELTVEFADGAVAVKTIPKEGQR